MKNFDMEAIKDFLFNHGEKVALGVCAFIAVTLGGWGLWNAMSAGRGPTGKPWHEEYDGVTKQIAASKNAVPKQELGKDKEIRLSSTQPWTILNLPFEATPYVSLPPDQGSRRGNPVVLAIKEGKEFIHLDYIRGIAYVHDGVANDTLRCFDGPAGAGGGGPGPGIGNPGGGIDRFKDKGKPPGGNQGMGGGGTAGPLDVVKAGEVRRMVLVTAVFPMAKQMEEFKRALRVSQKELLDGKEDLPYIRGMDIVKFEYVDGKKVNENGQVLIGFDPAKNKLEVAAPLNKLLRLAIYDDKVYEPYEPYVFMGLTTPLPKLGNVKYPAYEFKMDEKTKANLGLARLADDEPEQKNEGAVAGGGNPMPPVGKGGPNPMGSGPMLPLGKGGKDKMQPPGDNNPPEDITPDRKVVAKKPKQVLAEDPVLYERLFGKDHFYNIYHAMGLKEPAKDAPAEKDPKGFKPPMGGVGPGAGNNADRYFSAWLIEPPGGGVGVGGPGGGFGVPPGGVGPPKGKPGGDPMKPGVPGGAGAGENQDDVKWERDALVRFIDPDVIPGRTYQYVIRVRMANPNFDKPDLVAFSELAKPADLPPSPWVYTPKIAIPDEYYLFTVDQDQLDEWAHPEEKDPKKKQPAKKSPSALGKDEITFQIHQWTPRTSILGRDAIIGDWTIAERFKVRRGESIGYQAWVKSPVWYKDKDVFEVPLTTVLESKKNVLKQGCPMDFKTDASRPVLVDFTGGKKPKVDTVGDEDVAVDALILTPDGKLSVLNSRNADADPAPEISAERPDNGTRHGRVQAARQRILDLNPAASSSTDPAMPKGGGGPKIPGIKN